MPPPAPTLLPRRHLVGGATVSAKPVSLLSFPLPSAGLGCPLPVSSSSRGSTSSRRRFSSNAEQSAGSRRRWWSDEAEFDDADEEEFEEEQGYSFRGSASWADQALEEPWFTKVWRAYGYVLPVILVSILAATGPRAFLMAMAIPLAQSALSVAARAFSNTFGRRRRRDDDTEDYDDDYYHYSDYRSSGWEPEDAEDSYSYSTDYRYSSSSSRSQQQQEPWAEDAKPEDSEPTATAGSESDDTVSARSSTGFGGWDELDAGDGKYGSSSSRRRSAGAPIPKPPDPAAKTASAAGGAAARSVPVGRRRRPRRSRAAARYRQSPLLMRLLVAVFPFLGSWLRIML